MGGNTEEIYDDFEKLLLARARVRVMIFDGDYFNHAGRCPWSLRNNCSEGFGSSKAPLIRTLGC